MPTYGYYCEDCDQQFTRFSSLSNYQSERSCPKCGARSGRNCRDFASVGILNTTDALPIKSPGMNLAHKAGRSPAQQERLYKKLIGRLRDAHRRAKRERGTSRRSDNDIRANGSIPRELWHSRTKDYGKNYWYDEGKKALKRDGLDFD